MAEKTSGGTVKWKYVAVTANGQTREKGSVEAKDKEQAISKVSALGLIPIQLIDTSQDSILNKEIGGIKRMPKKAELAAMARQLSTMVTAGVSIIRSLEIIVEQISNERLREAVTQCIASIQAGDSFSASMAKSPEIFPPLMIHMVQAGETGGFLDEALTSVADSFESDVTLQRQVKSALTYPVIVLCLAAVLVAAMLIYVVPVFVDIFDQLNAELPFITKILVGMSKVAPFAVGALIVGGTAFSVYWSKNKNSDTIRSWWDPLKLKLPVFGNLNNKVALARFCSNFAAMLAAGVPILQALDIVGATSGNKVYEDATRETSKLVEKGYRLSDALSSQQVFPTLVIQMVRIGEDSGEIDHMLESAGRSYDEEVKAITKQLSSLLEPLMIVVLGVVVGAMLIALYYPMFTVYDNISG